jgi:hypothetical protein
MGHPEVVRGVVGFHWAVALNPLFRTSRSQYL